MTRLINKLKADIARLGWDLFRTETKRLPPWESYAQRGFHFYASYKPCSDIAWAGMVAWRLDESSDDILDKTAGVLMSLQRQIFQATVAYESLQ